MKLLLQFHLWGHNDEAFVTTYGGTTMELVLQFHLWWHNNGAKINVNCFTLRKASMRMSINYLTLRTSILPFSPSLISLMVSVDVKHHVYLLA